MNQQSNSMPVPVWLWIGVLTAIAFGVGWLAYQDFVRVVLEGEAEPFHWSSIPFEGSSLLDLWVGKGLISVGCLTAATLLLLRLTIAPMVSLFCYAVGGGVVLLNNLGTRWPPMGREEWWYGVVDLLIRPGVGWLYFAIASAGALWGMKVLHKHADYFRLQCVSPNASKSIRRRVLTVLTAALAWLLIGYFGVISLYLMGLILHDTPPLPTFPVYLAWVDTYLPFLAACLILWAGWFETVEADEEGIRLAVPLLRLSPFSARWKRVKRIDVISRPGRHSSVLVRRWIGPIPAGFCVHADRYEAGNEIVARIERLARKRGIPVVRHRVSDSLPLLALACTAWGFATFQYMFFTQYWRMVGLIDTNYPPPDFDSLADPVLFGGLGALGLSLFGAGLGFRSAYHQASPRPILLALWILVGTAIAPTPLLGWLVWIAVFMIYSAMSGVNEIAHPTLAEWGAGFFLHDYAGILSAVAYVAAVGLGTLWARERRNAETPAEAGG